MNKINTAFKVFLLISLLYFTWQLGRYSEYKKNTREFNESSVEAYYFTNPQIDDPFVNATKELYITGKIKEGRCK